MRQTLKWPQFRRSFTTIALSNPKKFDVKYAPELTLYIKGFLSRGEKKEDFSVWKKSHHRLINSHHWDPRAKGWFWECGHIKYPWPITTLGHLGYRFYQSTKALRLNPYYLAASTALDAGVFTARMMMEYHEVEKNTYTMSSILANDLERLSKKYNNIRIVAHSLGCRLVLNAIRQIPKEARPNSIHFMAPAFYEEEYSDILNYASKGKTYVYFSNKDIVLYTFLHLIKGKDAVGAHGLRHTYDNVVQKNVTKNFGNYWLVHNNYKHEYPNFIINDEFRNKLKD